MSKPAVIAPDGGWGWMVVFAAFTYQFISGFMNAAHAVLYIALQEEFDEGKSLTSWIMSLSSTMTLSTGAVAASLGAKYGYKNVTFVGGVLLGFSSFASSFANSITYIILTLGLMAGIGNGLCYVPMVAMCALYFDKKRSLAVGLGSCGIGLASFVFPPLVIWLEEEFTWRGMLWIISGCLLNTCALALLLRPLKTSSIDLNCHNEESMNLLHGGEVNAKTDLIKNEDYKKSEVVDIIEINKSVKESQVEKTVSDKERNAVQNELDLINGVSTSPAEIHETKSMLSPETETRLNSVTEIIMDKEKHLSTDQLKGRSQSFTQSILIPSPEIRFKLKCHNFSSLQEIYKRQNSIHDTTVDDHHQTSNYEGKRLTNSNMISIGDEYKYNILAREPILGSKHRSQTNDNQYFSNHNISKKELNRTCNHLYKSFKVYKDLISNWKCVLIISISSIVNLTYLIPILYLVDRAVENGIEKQSAVLAFSLFGAGNTCGRLCTGLLADRACVNRFVLYFLCIFLCGLFTCLSVFCGPHLVLHAIYGCTFGLCIGGYIILTPVVLVDILGVELVGQSYGLCLFFNGTSALMGAPIAGWLFDITGSYTISFVLYGCLLILSSLLLVPLVKTKFARGDNHEKT